MERAGFTARICAAIVTVLLMTAGCTHQRSAPATSAAGQSPLDRRYVEGERMRYVMTGSNQGREHAVTYTAEAQAEVVADDQGGFFEEIRWTRLEVMGQEVPIDSISRFRMRVSLDPAYDITPPDFAALQNVNPMLIGPIFDLMTFYVDLHPSLHQGRLRQVNDHTHVPHGQPNSWADGVNVIVGEDCIDFDLSLSHVDDRSAVLRVRHVPPQEASIRMPVQWLHQRVRPEAPNNWVQVQREAPDATRSDGGYVAASGHEMFDVRIEVERPSGRIVSATMDNPVDIVQRQCEDAELTDCGEPDSFRIHRRIELRRLP
jgi:hypothetical protein